MGLFDFLPGADSASPQSYDQMLLRQKIAMQLVGRERKGYPKTVGEGLTAIGDALGEMGMMRQAERMQAAIDASRKAKADAVAPETPATPPEKTSDAADVVEKPPVVAQDDTADTPLTTAESDVLGTRPAVAAYAPTAYAAPTDVASDAPPVTGAVDPQRDQIARVLTAWGVPQANPTLPGAQPPPTTALGGRPPDSVTSDIKLAPPIQLAQAGTKPAPLPPRMPPDSAMPPAVKPPGAAAEPVTPPPSVGRVPIPPSAQVMPAYPAAPPMPTLTPREFAAQKALRYETDPQMRAMYDQVIKEEEQKRTDAYAPILKDWETKRDIYTRDFEAERARQRNLPQTTLELQKGELQAAQAAEAEKLNQRLGNIPQEVYIAGLNKSLENVAGIPAATASIKRARALVDSMYHGAFADTDTFLSKVMGSAGFPVDPKVTGTEQFKTAMAGVLAQARKGIVGPGAQSEAELALLQKSTAADAKLDPETIRATLNAAADLNLQIALQHQKKVRLFAGEDDANRQQQVYGAYGMPSMVDLVPQGAVDKLRANANNPEAHRQFDDAFHTPGLSRDVLRYRR